MSARHLLTFGTAAMLVAGCESGDLNIQPSTTVTDSNNTVNEGGGGTQNPCASYLNTGGQTIRGEYDGTNCTYSASFVDAGNNLRTDLTIPALPNGGAHIFKGSLFVGETYTTDAELMAAAVLEGGDGPVLTIEAGATLAWESSANFMIVNRGSQIFAVGEPDAPITFTAVSDLNGTAGPEDVQQWGGIVINGFGVTNACEYTGSAAAGDLALAGECHVQAEGAAGLDESHYGGDNNDDSSGRLEHVVVKHTGATVGSGDELNGITFGGVGRNTIVRNLETYSTYDDGIEMFGGAVDFENFVAVYVRDDSIDIDEGWSGTITNALVIQSAGDGNHCIEADGIGSFDDLTDVEIEAIIDQGINSRPTINNLTCIISPNETGTHDPGAGWRFREGIFPTVADSMIVGSFPAVTDATPNGTDNYCLRIDNRSEQAAIDGDLAIRSSIIACHELVHDAANGMAGTATTEADFFTSSGNAFQEVPPAGLNPTAAADTELQVLEGTPPVYSIAYATSAVGGTTPPASDPPQSGDFVGALSSSLPDWTAPWAYGIRPDNRGQDLWFE